jgi:hypothetical protein
VQLSFSNRDPEEKHPKQLDWKGPHMYSTNPKTQVRRALAMAEMREMQLAHPLACQIDSDSIVLIAGELASAAIDEG